MTTTAAQLITTVDERLGAQYLVVLRDSQGHTTVQDHGSDLNAAIAALQAHAVGTL